jgi:hypothetical protein
LSSALRFAFFSLLSSREVFAILAFSEGGRVHQYSQQRPTPSPPIEIAQFLGFSRFYFVQRPLCKVGTELCTEKGIPTATAQGYALATVDKFWIRAVDNWGRLGKIGEEK